MIYARLTDNELRLAVDNSPQDVAIRDEVVKRFINAATPDEVRQDGYTEGYNDGREVGFGEGYNEGYDDGRADTD